MKLIQDDAQYERAREALLNMAAELDDPLSNMTGEERTRKNLIYDRTAESIREYRRSELVVVYPGLKQVYEQLNYPYRDFSTQMDSYSDPDTKPLEAPTTNTPPKPEPPPVEPVAPPNEKPKAKVDLSAWLDD